MENKPISEEMVPIKELHEAFRRMNGRYNMIVLLRKKIIELGGDPDFYLTDQQREDRKKWEHEMTSGKAPGHPFKLDKVEASSPFTVEYFTEGDQWKQ